MIDLFGSTRLLWIRPSLQSDILCKYKMQHSFSIGQSNCCIFFRVGNYKKNVRKVINIFSSWQCRASVLDLHGILRYIQDYTDQRHPHLHFDR